MVTLPLRFRNRRQREDHYLNHAVEFGPPPRDDMEYEKRASEFALAPPTETVRQDTRPLDNATIKWDRTSDEFVVVTHDAFSPSIWSWTRSGTASYRTALTMSGS